MKLVKILKIFKILILILKISTRIDIGIDIASWENFDIGIDIDIEKEIQEILLFLDQTRRERGVKKQDIYLVFRLLKYICHPILTYPNSGLRGRAWRY